MSLLMLFVGCICPMQEIQNENENVAQIRGVMYMKIIAIIEDDQHIGDILERTGRPDKGITWKGSVKESRGKP